MDNAAIPQRSKTRTQQPRLRSDANIHIRATAPVKHLIETAAASVGKTLSEFVLDSARQHATNVVLDQRLFVLDSEKYDAFVAALDKPPPAGPKLKALMRRKPLWKE